MIGMAVLKYRSNPSCTFPLASVDHLHLNRTPTSIANPRPFEQIQPKPGFPMPETAPEFFGEASISTVSVNMAKGMRGI